MYNQIENIQEDSFTHSVKLFILGMAVAFSISIFINANHVPNSLSETSSIDCNNQASLVEAQDRSRNGIANGCPNIFKNHLE